MRAPSDFHVHIDPDELALQQLAGGHAGDGAKAAAPKGGAARGRGARSGEGRSVRSAAAGGPRRYAFRRS